MRVEVSYYLLGLNGLSTHPFGKWGSSTLNLGDTKSGSH